MLISIILLIQSVLLGVYYIKIKELIGQVEDIEDYLSEDDEDVPDYH